MSALAESFAPARTRIDLAPLLPVLAPLALLAPVLVALAPGLVVQDTWLALVAGRELVEHGLPSTNELTVLATGHRWVDQQWLAQLVLYGAARCGVGTAVALCVLAAVVAFGLCADVARRRGASPLALLAFLVWAVVAAPWGLQFRTQALALPLFALVLWLLERDRAALVLPVLCLWANVHGSVVVGAAVALAYAIVRRAPVLLLAPLAVFASPYAAELPGYYRTMLLDPPFGRVLAEWQRTTPTVLTAAFFLLAAAMVVLVVRRRSRVSAYDAVVLAVTLFVALQAIRGVVWFALACLALLPTLATRRDTAAIRGAVPAVLALAVVVAALAVAAGRSYESRYPAGLPEAARGHLVLADEATADWLLWRVPSLRGRVAYDVAFELLSPAQIDRLLAWRRLEPGWQRVARGYDLVVDDAPHTSRLVATGRWRRVLPGVVERDR